MDGAPGGNPHVAGQPPDQKLPDLACAPMQLLAFEPDNQARNRLRQLIGVAHRPPRTVAQGLKTVLLVAVENLVAGLTRYTELPAHVRHGLTVQQAGDKAKALFHDRTRFPRHQHLPPKSEKCYPCVRYEVSPMSQAAHSNRKLVRSAQKRTSVQSGDVRTLLGPLSTPSLWRLCLFSQLLNATDGDLMHLNVLDDLANLMF